MNLDELRSVQSKERQKDSLQNLRPSFYQEVGEYIADLEDERDRVAEQVEDPFSSPEVGRLTDEIETAKDVVEAIYERRMGKLVKQASLAAAGMPADDEGLTAEEADLFDDLVARIESNKNRVLDVLEGVESATGSPGTAAEPEPGASGEPTDPDSIPGEPTPDRANANDAPPAPPEPPSTADDSTADEGPGGNDSSGVTPADVMGDGPSVGETDPNPGAADRNASPDSSDGGSGQPSESPENAASDPDGASTGPRSDADTDSVPDGSDADSAVGDSDADVDRTTVRITSDIGAILGVDDREYTLSSDDVVTLPEQNAAPLVEREAAERLE